MGGSRKEPWLGSARAKIKGRTSQFDQHNRRDVEIMIRMGDSADEQAVIVAVPVDAVRELEREGLAFALPILRGTVTDAVVMVGMDAAALVTLLQAPDSIRAFAAWIRDRYARRGDSIELRARRETCKYT